MTRAAPRTPLGVVLAPFVVLVLVLGGLLTAVSPTATADSRDARSDATVDARIGQRVCGLLGRAYVADAGCSRRRCARPDDFINPAGNAEVCFVGGRQQGFPYGQPIDYRRCDALHRTWVPAVNYCVSNPFRGKRLIEDADSCRAPYTTYITLTEAEGYYDLCLQPSRVAQLKAIADRTGDSLAEVAAQTSPELCSYRPRTQFRNKRCRTATGPIPKADQGGTVLIGDSVSWRGQNELARRRPDWTLDGIPFRHVVKLPSRSARYARGHGRPAGLIVALGTNPTPGWDRDDYARALKMVRRNGIVMYVTPYREPGTQSPGTVQATQRYAKQMRRITRANDHVCLADWRMLVRSRPGKLLVDGVHQTAYGERLWASFISRSWQQCLKVVAQQDAENADDPDDPGQGPGDGQGDGQGDGDGDGDGDGGDDGDDGGLLPLPELPPLPPLPLPLPLPPIFP